MVKSYTLGAGERRWLLLFIFLFLCSTVTIAQTEKDPKIDKDLLQLSEAAQRKSPSKPAEVKGLSASNRAIQVVDGYVVIEAIAEKNADALLKSLEDLGLQHGSAYGGMVSGLLPIEAIDKLSAVPALKFARPAYKPSTNIGSVSSQGDTAQYSNKARKSFGVEGFGTKVGILSDSYDNLDGASQGIATGDLPGTGNPFGYTDQVEVLVDLPSGGSDEGRAMAELIHDVAPGAKMAFYTAFLGQPSFANGILQLADSGCNVIVDDIIYLTEPMFQDGIIAQAADEAVKTGAAYFSAAGNNLDRSYESEFRDGGNQILYDYLFGFDLGEYVLHDFDPGPGVDHFQRVTIPSGSSSFDISFQWDDPFASACEGCPGAATDMDIFLALEDGDYASMFIYPYVPNTGGDAVELIGVSNSGPPVDAYIVIGKWIEGPGPNPNPGRIKYVDFGPGADPEYDTKSGTCFGHANAALATTVGAVRYDKTPAYGVRPPIREVFSSSGGVSILFDKQGNRIKPAIRKKPEISAPQGTNTSFFGFEYEEDSFPNFFGTSASAPHAAAAGALMLETAGNSNLSPAEMKKYMSYTAIDMEDPFKPGSERGFDFGTGYGLLATDKAAALALLERRVQPLKFTSVCSSAPGEQRKWKITNPNAFDIPISWNLFKTSQEGKLIARAKSDTYFYTRTLTKLPNIVTIYWRGTLGIPALAIKTSWGTYCPDPVSSPVARTYSTEIEDGFELSSLSDDFLFELYPNPVSDKLSVSFLMDWEEDFQIKLFDPTGKLQLSQEKHFSSQDFSFEIDMNRMNKGIYILQLVSDTRNITRKFIKN